MTQRFFYTSILLRGFTLGCADHCLNMLPILKHPQCWSSYLFVRNNWEIDLKKVQDISVTVIHHNVRKRESSAHVYTHSNQQHRTRLVGSAKREVLVKTTMKDWDIKKGKLFKSPATHSEKLKWLYLQAKLFARARLTPLHCYCCTKTINKTIKILWVTAAGWAVCGVSLYGQPATGVAAAAPACIHSFLHLSSQHHCVAVFAASASWHSGKKQAHSKNW